MSNSDISVIVYPFAYLYPHQIEMLKSFSGDRSKLGTAEDFFVRLLEVKQ